MKGGTLEYKCRRCGEMDASTHVPDILHAIVCLAGDLKLPNVWFGSPVGKLGIHNCKDGGLGVSNLIGGIEDEKE